MHLSFDDSGAILTRGYPLFCSLAAPMAAKVGSDAWPADQGDEASRISGHDVHNQ